MKVAITEYLEINLDTEESLCRRCGHPLGSARDNYKRGLLVYNRNPREIHRPLLDDQRYRFTFAPDAEWCRILEYYCPECGVQMETEYLPQGHPPTWDIQLDIDDLKRRWSKDASQR